MHLRSDPQVHHRPARCGRTMGESERSVRSPTEAGTGDADGVVVDSMRTDAPAILHAIGASVAGLAGELEHFRHVTATGIPSAASSPDERVQHFPAAPGTGTPRRGTAPRSPAPAAGCAGVPRAAPPTPTSSHRGFAPSSTSAPRNKFRRHDLANILPAAPEGTTGQVSPVRAVVPFDPESVWARHHDSEFWLGVPRFTVVGGRQDPPLSTNSKSPPVPTRSRPVALRRTHRRLVCVVPSRKDHGPVTAGPCCDRRGPERGSDGGGLRSNRARLRLSVLESPSPGYAIPDSRATMCGRGVRVAERARWCSTAAMSSASRTLR